MQYSDERPEIWFLKSKIHIFISEIRIFSVFFFRLRLTVRTVIDVVLPEKEVCR